MSVFHPNKYQHSSDADGLQLEQLEDRMMLSTVEILAAGSTGQEQLDLFIDDVHVRSYQDVSQSFETFVFESEETLTADQISIGFGNDFYNPATGFDRNLIVDRIIVDGITYHTEDPSTSSTGIWRDGFTGGGNFETEVLNINAIFSYSTAGSNARTLIEVDAMGQTGEEYGAVLVNGSLDDFVIFDSPNERSTFRFDTDADIDLDGLRIEFVNDVYDPANNFDRNLYVYSIKVTDLVTGKSQFASTSDSNVYSEGVYQLADGFQAGFGRGPQLFANGFVEVQATTG